MKRTFDFLLSIIGIIVLLPIYMIIILFVLFSLGPPVIFKQTRPGLQGKPFTCYKFRTMTRGKNVDDELLSDEFRLTKFGRLLRKTSLDEFPSLWNVLKGDMSLVGPRPLLVEYLDRYSSEQVRRHEVKPGITGWAQVNGRNAITWEEKFELDVWYVDNQSFWLDLKILFITIWKVLKGEGISNTVYATMPEFMGKNNE